MTVLKLKPKPRFQSKTEPTDENPEPHSTNCTVRKMTVFCLQLMPPVHSNSDLFNAVVEALSEIAPAEHYLRTNVMLPSGHIIGDDLV